MKDKVLRKLWFGTYSVVTGGKGIYAYWNKGSHDEIKIRQDDGLFQYLIDRIERVEVANYKLIQRVQELENKKK